MRIKFLCPHCGRVCRVPADLAGKQGRCPGCNKGLEVPTESTLQSKRKSSLGSVDRSDSKRTSRASGAGRRSSGTSRRASRRSSARNERPPSGAGETSEETAGPADVAEMEELPPQEAEQELNESEKQRNCPHCARTIAYDTTACPHCGGDAALKGIPWQILVSIVLFLCAPFPGIIFGMFGLRSARRRKAYVNLAWAAVGLNAFSMVANALFLLGKALNQ